MDPITMAPGNPNTDETLLGILQRLRDLSQQPLVPQNPMAQLGTVMQGFAAGTQGQQNPALQMYAQQRQQQLTGLGTEATIGSALSTLQHQQTQRATESKKLQATIAGDLMKHLPDNPGAITLALKKYKELGLFEGDDAAIATIAKSGMAKSLQDRLKLASGALEAGVNPATLGINLSPTAMQALQGMSPEQRVDLFGPDAKKTFLANQDATIKLQTDKIVLSAKQKIDLGTATPDDYRLAGVGMKSPDEVIGSILADFYAGKRLTPEKGAAVQQYLQTKKLQGLTGDAQLALRAANGDAEAGKALDLLKPPIRNMTEVELYYRAGQVKAKQIANPTYQPSVDEQAVLNAADLMAERRTSKPLPETAVKRFSSMRVILGQLGIVQDLVERQGAGKFLGPVKGPLGKAQEKLGIAPSPTRQQLQTALSILLAEVGPEKFGGQFTLPEQVLVRDFLASVNAPEQFFKTKLNAVTRMMEQKYRNDLSMAATNKYRVPEEFAVLPGQEPTPPTDEFSKRYRDLRLQGKSPEEIKRILGGTP